jgi:hypothetical protein
MSLYYDYVVQNYKITVVAAAGNTGASNSIGSPSSGQNVISVAATNANKGIAFFSSSGLSGDFGYYLRKPTISAPGGRLTGIPNIPYSLSGTSYAAPFVTGIIALLMQEFTFLKSDPKLVMSVLTASATPLLGQNNTWDFDGGAGLVNYQRARTLLRSGNYESGTNPNGTNGTIVMTRFLHIPANKSLKLSTVVQSNTAFSPFTIFLPTLIFTKYKIRVYDGSALIDEDDFLSNIFLLDINNSSNSVKNYKVEVVQVGSKSTSSNEYIAMAAYINSAPTNYNVFSHILTVVSSNTTSHIVTCSCGYNPGNYHVANSVNRCIYCGYNMNSGIGLGV